MDKTKTPTLIIDRVYLGNFSSSRNEAFINENNITHILTVANDIEPEYPNNCSYKVINVEDWHEENLSSYFQECFNFIDEGIATGGILVHCHAGISRSPTIIIGYLMARKRMTLEEAFHFVKQKKAIIKPNHGFLEQLKDLEENMFGKRSNFTLDGDKALSCTENQNIQSNSLNHSVGAKY